MTSYQGHVQLTAKWGTGCQEKSPSRDWHWGHGKKRKHRWRIQMCLLLLLLCGWKILQCMQASSCLQYTWSCSSTQAAIPVYRETKSCISWLAETDGLQDTWRKKGLPHNSWALQQLWPKAPSLSQKQDIADPWRDAVL